MLWQRVITALILLPLAIFAIFSLRLESFSLVVALIMLVGSWEWTGFIRNVHFGLRLAYVVVTAGIMLYVVNHALPMAFWHGWIFPEHISEWFKLRDAAFISLLLGALWWLFAFVLVLVFPRISQSFSDKFIVMAIVGWLILIPTWVALTGLRSIGIGLDFYRGSSLLLFALCLVWAADTGAFFSGKLLGKHKLAAHVSPKKTWEGVIGGAVLASVVAYLGVIYLSIPETQYLGLALVTLVVVAFSVVGDLTESIFKRLANVKDSGQILPGHGGILDRIDALTSAMPLCLLGFAIVGIT